MLAAIILSLVSGTSTRAQGGPGDLLITPTRLVFEGRQRTAEITLVNTGSAAATYRIGFVNLRMNDQGGTAEIAAADAVPGEQFSEALIRFSPRQVTLEPKVVQTVRMQLRLPADLAPGEYRSHLLFRAIPAATPAAPAAQPTGFSVQLTAIYGISIPIIVRHGETSAKVTLDGLTLSPATAADPMQSLQFWMRRVGNQSVFGNLTVTFVPATGAPQVVAFANGVAVYSPNTARRAAMALRLPSGAIPQHGRLHLAYTEVEKDNATIAEADLPVQ
ncbi:MAG: molecular chaperone [Acidobacteriota bacterium]